MRQAGVLPKVEITPAMIAAGMAAFEAWETSDDPYPANAVRAIYSRMKMVVDPDPAK